MAQAITLARLGWYSARPNPRVGCVLVKDGKVVGEGAHLRAGEPHAEVYALQMAGAAAQGATCYVSLEPCAHFGCTPPCARALIDAGLQRVVYAIEDPDPRVAGAGAAMLEAAGIAVTRGVLAESARQLNRGFLSRVARNRPFVRAKVAMSIDGRIALADGRSKWITSEAARHDVQRLRAESCAIMVGRGTVMTDDPSLTVRDAQFDIPEQPLRVVLDTQLALNPASAMLQQAGSSLIYTASTDDARMAVLRQAGATVRQTTTEGAGLAIAPILADLAQQDINDLLVESGPGLTTALLTGGWLDELIIYVAPRLLGADSRAVAGPLMLNELSDSPTLEISDIRQIGKDIRITAIPRIADN
ncbi:MAG: bifunctional diaminohydroxyphosphoribosylaminopyrimidine deaminase/5-amino-6-(5-phosphoribosylamino)uracil reductase RibD [Gammaproteobacteria bacterium]|nr:bifunctional diaminohydroxyphosphoribosylaminopyrimidine deaminase/5-amino-6-(5-phosphoribosylamino)uracil reductase RibD [Gammaproteobacteria bacterium]